MDTTYLDDNANYIEDETFEEYMVSLAVKHMTSSARPYQKIDPKIMTMLITLSKPDPHKE